MNATISSLRLTPPSAPNADVSSYHWVHADTTILPVVLRAANRTERSQLEAAVRTILENHIDEVHGLISGLLEAFGETTLHINSGRYNQQRTWTNHHPSEEVADGAMTVVVTSGLSTGPDAPLRMRVSSTAEDLREAAEACLRQMINRMAISPSDPLPFREGSDAV